MTKPLCIIAGVGSGNSSAFARRFHQAGYRLALLARSNDTAQVLVNELDDAKAYICDLTDAQAVAATFAQIQQDLGQVETLVYNAGSRVFRSIEEASEADMLHAWQVDVLGCFLCIKQVIPVMQTAQHGNIIAIGATASLKGFAGSAPFSASKAAQRNLMQSTARHLDPQGIHVAYVIVDGVLDSAFGRELCAGQPDAFFMQARDVAESVYFLTTQAKSAWTFELDLRPFGEKW